MHFWRVNARVLRGLTHLGIVVAVSERLFRMNALSSIQPQLLAHNSLLMSPGQQFSYRVIGPCCRLYDREQLPWPCCRLQWHSKEPSWRRIGPRFVADMAARRYPSYAVELIGLGGKSEPLVISLYMSRLSASDQGWWYTKRRSLPTPLQTKSVPNPMTVSELSLA